ncbi:hypothetical protein F5Y05DRAFT_237124 [Hypoxylon sp. FL0543]|nr:hypothetical protein F5Y05DRAFT_237124 [Hypoxylon sp. FL0543]
MSPSSPVPTPADPARTNVSATYTNSKFTSSSSSQTSTAPFTISTPLALPGSDSTTHKTAYLSSLRNAVSALQERVNSELTARMEEEARELAATSTAPTTSRKAGQVAAAGSVDEAAEEENYGEEVIEDEEA